MNHQILIENQKKRMDVPWWRLICFAMFNLWQMGFIYYFLEPSSALDGKIPLPINVDYGTALTVICYVLSILTMIFLPKIIVWVQRIDTGIALLSAVAFFLPLGEEALRFNIYLQIFCCCLLIGFETFLVVNYFSEKSSITYLTLAYGVPVFLISLVQNEVLSVTFSVFRFGIIGALMLLLVFFLGMPSGKKHLPRYVKKSDGIKAPKKLISGTFLLIFIIGLMGTAGPAIAGKIEHGVSIMYLVVAVACFVFYVLYKKANIHPFRMIPASVGLGGLGFLLMIATSYLPWLSYVACVLIGFGMVSCMMGPLFGVPIMKSYPSKFVAPGIIGVVVFAVLTHAVIGELFLGSPTAMYIVYAVIMGVLVFVYTQVEPFLLFTLRRRIADDTLPTVETRVIIEPAVDLTEQGETPLGKLSPKKREVAELICMGYTNKDIAKTMVISEHTVKDYVKDIYLALEVHSRIELAALVNRYRLMGKQ